MSKKDMPNTRARDQDAGEPQLGSLLVWAAAIGVVASVGAVIFIVVMDGVQTWLWKDLPGTFGWQAIPWWWILAMLIVGSFAAWAACQLPGHGGHRPLDEMALNITPRAISSVVLAALASLIFGAVVGPEAPLMAIGTAIAIMMMRTDRPDEKRILIAAGAAAAIGAILGNPMITAILVLEGVVLKGTRGGKDAMVGLMPILVALGFGYLVQVGLGPLSGIGESVLAIPGLPEYATVEPIDLLAGLAVAIAAAILGVLALRIAQTIMPKAAARPLTVILGAGVTLAIVAVAVTSITGESVDTILFSGQSGMADALAITSFGTLAVIGVGKMIAYGISLGSGYRGGMIFPSVYVGVVVGAAGATLIPDANLSALIACAVAAAVGSILRLPFTSALLAVLLCAAAGPAVTTLAIIGAIVGILIRVSVDAALNKRVGEQSTHLGSSVATA